MDNVEARAVAVEAASRYLAEHSQPILAEQQARDILNLAQPLTEYILSGQRSR